MRWVRTWGTGAPVAYLHGLGCGNLASWADTAARTGRPALFVDLVGHGLSDRPASFGYTLVEHADAVAAALSTVGAPVDVLAHSLGGSVAVVLADRHPHLVRSLVLVEPGLDPVAVEPGDLAAHSEADLPHGGWDRLLSRETPERRAEVRTADPLAVVRSAVAICDALGGTLNDVLARTTVPTLLVAGFRTYDRWDALRAAGVRCERVEGGGHFVMLERPEEFARLVQEFTTDVAGAA
ncbi:pimeloyl-ACP methyl ester carboxylesterase [Kineococcus rhizosphaerae]|uniref:Pimeloyl-ACP methyl ester carboxylesterase n=1 Tax=Kineococcus rhizosphaerae TaxID=559628 RepID=A0A2T0QXF9_9ACTN|nr:pimeloyl-ACP methyl ester carboxylesterase [Kineococcus rhizosphaerae]